MNTRDPRYRRKRNQWDGYIQALTMEAGNKLPRPLAHASVEAVLWFTTSRRRDEDNYRALLSKWAGDALQRTGHIADDTPDYYEFNRVHFLQGDREATQLTIHYQLPGESA